MIRFHKIRRAQRIWLHFIYKLKSLEAAYNLKHVVSRLVVKKINFVYPETSKMREINKQIKIIESLQKSTEVRGIFKWSQKKLKKTVLLHINLKYDQFLMLIFFFKNNIL